MNPPPTNWLPGLIVLAVGCVAAAFYLFLQRSKVLPEAKKGAPAARTGELEDLDRRYQSLIEQLKELAADKHSVTPERFASERSRLELEAAAALRARDEFLKNPATAVTAAPPAPTASWLSPQLKGALWGGGIVLFFCTLGYLLVSEQHARGDQESVTGKLPPGMSANAGSDAQPGAQDAQGQQDPDLEQAWDRFKNNPSDLEAAAVLSHELIRRQMYEDAERITQRGLSLDPFYVELRVHQGVLRAVRGDEAGAEQQLRMLADLYPDAQEGMLFLGALEMRQGDKAKALESFERFAVEVPTNMHPPPLMGAIQQLRSELGRR